MLAFYLGVSAQNTAVIKESCKKQDIEIVAGNCLPKGYAIVGTGSLSTCNDCNKMEDLKDDQIKELQHHGKVFKSCKVFVDFNNEILKLDQAEPSADCNNCILIYALRPVE